MLPSCGYKTEWETKGAAGRTSQIDRIARKEEKAEGREEDRILVLIFHNYKKVVNFSKMLPVTSMEGVGYIYFEVSKIFRKNGVFGKII